MVIKKLGVRGGSGRASKLGTVLKALNLIKLNIPTSFGDLKNRGRGGSGRASKLGTVLKALSLIKLNIPASFGD